MTYIILDQSQVTNTHSMFEYDEEGNEIPGTETTWETGTVTTKVEYDFGDLGKYIIDVAHFNPQSEEDIITGIENRAVSEQRKLETN